MDFPGLVAQMIKNPPIFQIPGSGRSPGEGNGNPLQHSCLGNPTDRWARRATHSPWGCNYDYIGTTGEKYMFLRTLCFFHFQCHFYLSSYSTWWIVPKVREVEVFFNLFFSWRIIALQNSIVFCQISTTVDNCLGPLDCLHAPVEASALVHVITFCL